MKNTAHVLGLALIIFCFSGTGDDAKTNYTVSNTRLTPQVINFLEEYIEKKMERKRVPGLALALIENDSVVLTKGYGVKSVKTKEPVDENTLFHIGSTHKSFTALLFACLADDAICNWSDTVSKLRPDWHAWDSRLENVTVYELLSMTSGIKDFDEDYFWDDYGDNAVPAEIFTFLADWELWKDPGRKFSYSNLAVSFAGYLAVYAAGGNTADLNHGYADLLQHYVLTPIGMSNSTVFISEAEAYGNRALPHIKDRKEMVVVQSEDRDDDPLAPSGSLKSSANDMARYLITHIQEGINPDGTRVVSAQNISRTWEPNPVSKRARYGMGWETKYVKKTPVVFHEGAYDNYCSIIVLLPEKKIGMAILSNSESADPIIRKSYRILLKAMKKHGTL